MPEDPALASALTTGAEVGNYRIDRKIGEGGMGAVYLATHPLLGRKAAVKVLLPEHSKRGNLVTRFFNEAKTAASLRHPALVEVFDFGFLADGSGYLVMDYIEGESLAARLERVAPLAPEVAAEIARQIALGVGAAHGQGIVHRDLKPDNIFLVPDPEAPTRERVKILDFGIAKLVLPGGTGSKGATSTGMLLGTPLFMAPEQCRGAGHVDHRADIYSTGCILYMMLTARPPFDLEGVGEILAAHLYQPVTSPRTIAPAIPEALERIVMRALEKSPDARYPSMAELAADLHDFLVSAAPEAPAVSPWSSRTLPLVSGSASPSGARPVVAAPSGARPVVPTPSAASRPRVSAPMVAPTTLSGAAAPSDAAPVDGSIAPRGHVRTWLTAGALVAVVAVGGGLWWQRGRALEASSAPASSVPSSPPAPSLQPKSGSTPVVPATSASAPKGAPSASPAPSAASPAAGSPAAPTSTSPDPAKGEPSPGAPKPSAEHAAHTNRRPGRGTQLFNEGIDLSARGDEEQALRAFQNAIAAGGLSGEDRAQADRAVVSLSRKFGQVDIVTDVSGAEIAVDGRPAGRTPLALPLLVRPGKHVVTVRRPGQPPAMYSVSISPGESAAIHF